MLPAFLSKRFFLGGELGGSTWNPKQPVSNGCLVISNHFLCNDLELSNCIYIYVFVLQLWKWKSWLSSFCILFLYQKGIMFHFYEFMGFESSWWCWHRMAVKLARDLTRFPHTKR